MSHLNMEKKIMNKEYKQIITYSGLASDGYNFCQSDTYSSDTKTYRNKQARFIRKKFDEYKKIFGCIRLQEDNRNNLSGIISDIIVVTYKDNDEVKIDNWINPNFKTLVSERGWVVKPIEKKYV